MVKHTPGPWVVAMEYDCARIEDGDSEYVALVNGTEVDSDGHQIITAEGKANAALIAAAPELLAALEETARALEKARAQLAMHASVAAMFAEALAKSCGASDGVGARARVAIAKAEGRS